MHTTTSTNSGRTCTQPLPTCLLCAHCFLRGLFALCPSYFYCCVLARAKGRSSLRFSESALDERLVRWISCIYFIINIVINLGLVKIDVFYLFFACFVCLASCGKSVGCVRCFIAHVVKLLHDAWFIRSSVWLDTCNKSACVQMANPFHPPA